jgi:O-antigen/teichoic acid export membrane protein
MTSRRRTSPYEMVENPVNNIGDWLGVGFWAVTDQGLFGVGNFILAAALARWLSPVEYGSFAAAYSMLQLLAAIHAALFIEPMLVFGRGRFRVSFRRYLGAVVEGHWVFAAITAAALIAAGAGIWVWNDRVFASSLFAFALAGPFILLFWMTRRIFYALLEPHLAAAVSAAYTAVIVGLLYALRSGGLLSAVSAPLAMGAASALLAAITLSRLKVAAYGGCGVEQRRDIYTLHWRYGRWAVPTGALSWVPANAYCLALPIVGGLEYTAAFSALMTLVTPAQQVISAVAGILIPSFGQARQSGSMRRLVLLVLAGLSLGSAVYVALLGIAGEEVMWLLYGGRYAEYSHLAWIVGLVVIPSSVIAVLGSTLRVLERPDRVFWAYAASAAITWTAGMAATAHWHLTGAVVGQFISYSATALVMLWLLVAMPRSEYGRPA